MLKARNLNIIAILMFFVGLSMIPSALWSLFESSSYSYLDRDFYDFIAILKSAFIPIFFGILFYLITNYKLKGKKNDLRAKDGFVIVTLGWVAIALFGALPFYFSITPLSFTDAFFESMSGLTTTGASVLGDSSTYQIEELSKGTPFGI